VIPHWLYLGTWTLCGLALLGIAGLAWSGMRSANRVRALDHEVIVLLGGLGGGFVLMFCVPIWVVLLGALDVTPQTGVSLPQ
jgi:hypothetical protein